LEVVLVITYILSGQVFDKEVLEAANMQECQATKRHALTGVTPVTTRYGKNVGISAECQEVKKSAGVGINS
jgi:hypothetical protein